MSEASLKRRLYEEELKKDPKYRKYVALVERNLSSFDAVNEWPDIIAFLGRLLKCFQAHPQFTVIPHKITIAKRLAQSLNPALPSGVHQKALEVYAHIFQATGPDQLAVDLSLYSYGLFPFLQHAAMSVKPQLLSIFESYYFALGTRLKGCLKSFIIALLPGLEEEGSEFFPKVFSMMNFLLDTVGPADFYESMWICLVTNPQHRMAELNYLTKRIPKFSTKQDMVKEIGDNTQLMIRAFSASLDSKPILVQRSVLELMVVNFPLKHRLVGHKDLTYLMRSAVCVVLRRDMSLNRRLYAWLLGSSENQKQSSEFFETYAKQAVVDALEFMLRSPYHKLVDAQRPYRVLVSLLDKIEIGASVVTALFKCAISTLKEKVDAGINWSIELLQTVNMFYEMLDPFMTWSQVFEYVDKELANDGTETDATDLAAFIVSHFGNPDEETEQIYLPMFFLGLLARINALSNSSNLQAKLPQLIRALNLALGVLHRIPRSVFGVVETRLDHDRPYAESARNNGMRSHESASHPHAFEPARLYENHADLPQDDQTYSATTVNGDAGRIEIVAIQAGTDVLSHVQNFFIPPPVTQSVASDISAPDAVVLPTTSDPASLTREGLHDSRHGEPLVTPALERRTDEVRGQALIQEATRLLQEFLARFIGSNVLYPPEVDKGNGRRLQAHRVPAAFDKACEILRTLANYFSRGDNTDCPTAARLMREGPWSSALLQCCSESGNFDIVNAALSTLVELCHVKGVLAPRCLDCQRQVDSILQRLWEFLGPAHPGLHLRTVQLLWKLHDATTSSLVETALCRLLSDEIPSQRLSSFDRFSVFWRLSDEVQTSDALFTRPMFLMLDTLRDDNPSTRMAGETWLRLNLKSFVRIVDPIMLVLLDDSIIWKHYTPFGGKSDNASLATPVFVYRRPFDQPQVGYAFDTLITVCRYGGQSLLKSMRSTLLTARVAAAFHGAEGPQGLLTYMAALIKVAVRFIQTEVPPEMQRESGISNDNIHVHATDLLHCILSRTDVVNQPHVVLIQEMVVRKLLYCIASRKLDLQTRMLHLLHATVVITGPTKRSAPSSASVSPSRQPRHNPGSPRNPAQYGPPAVPDPTLPIALDDTAAPHPRVVAVNLSRPSTPPAVGALEPPAHLPTGPATPEFGSSPLFLRLLLDALSVGSNRPILQHWMDFIFTSLPQLRNAFKRVVLPLIMCLCEQLTRNKLELQTSLAIAQSGVRLEPSIAAVQDPRIDRESRVGNVNRDRLEALCSAGGADPSQFLGADVSMIILLNGLERILNYCLVEGRLLDEGEGHSTGGRLNATESSTGLRVWAEYVTSVFGGEAPVDIVSPEQKARDMLLAHLGKVFQTVLGIWTMLRNSQKSLSKDETCSQLMHEKLSASLSHAADRIRYRMRHLMDRLYKHHAVEVVEAMVEVWFMNNSSALDLETDNDDKYDNSSIEMLGEIPSYVPREVYSILVEGVHHRCTGLSSLKPRKTTSRSNKLTDIALLKYMEVYCNAIVGTDMLAELWASCVAFVKDYFSQASSFKYAFPYLLKIMTIMSQKLAQSSKFDGQRLHSEALDAYQRTLDYCILIAGKSFDQGIWRRTARDSDDAVQTTMVLDLPADPALRKDPLGSTDSLSSLPESVKKGSVKTKEDIMIQQVMNHLATSIVPCLRIVLPNPDRIVAVLSNLVYYVVGPTLKNKHSKLYDVTLEVLSQLAPIPAGYRTWKKEAWDAFLDQKFFSMSPKRNKAWRVVVQTMLATEKEKLHEVLGKISSSASTALFANRESEMLNRAYMLRHIAYILYCGEKDQYFQQLPAIQEKLVELIRLDVETVHKEIFLCLRVLLCRISNQHLANWWPVMLNELIKLFESCIYQDEMRTEVANVVLAGCKFLDLVFALEPDEFQIHQWIFVTETINSKIDLGDTSGAMLCRVAEKISSTSAAKTELASQNTLQALSDLHASDMDRPAEEGRLQKPVLRRPTLMLRSVTSIRDLYPFLSSVAGRIPCSVLELSEPDNEFIEEVLEADLLDEDDNN